MGALLAFLGFRRIVRADPLTLAFSDLAKREAAARRQHKAVRPIRAERQARLHAILRGNA